MRLAQAEEINKYDTRGEKRQDRHIDIAVNYTATGPWLNDQQIHDKVFQEKAHKDGTYDWVIYPDGTKRHELICDYKVRGLHLAGG